jgi:hypothetical protein
MSYTSITQASRDSALRDRVVAAAQKESRLNAEMGATDFGQAVVNDAATDVWGVLGYAVAIDTEAAYESALISGNPNPGGDPAVITDGAILSSVQASWPADPWPAP